MFAKNIVFDIVFIHYSFMRYKVDHAVMLVAWGQDNRGQQYWKIQNSWGQGWGEQGYFRVVRGQNFCGIESDAVFGSVKVAPTATLR